MMFVSHCSACDRDQLVFPSLFTGARTGEHGLEITYTCWCGAEQTHLPEVARPDRRREGHQLVA